LTRSWLRPGWEADEKVALRFAAWHFYFVSERDHRSSVSEDNLVVRGKEEMKGEVAITQLLTEEGLAAKPDAVKPEVVAGQLAMFLVHGTSRSSCLFRVVTDVGKYASMDKRFPGKLHAPQTVVGNGQLVHRSWLDVDRGLVHLVVKLTPDGKITIDQSEALPSR
jgi:hypothetical protein